VTSSADQPAPVTFPQPGSTTARGTQKAGDKKIESAQGRTGDTVKENVPVPVRVPVTEPPSEHPEAAVAVRFSLQIGAFTLQANAEAQKEHFETLGYTADMVSKVRDTRSLFIVLIGDYATYDEAKIASVGVKKKLGIDAFVISR
jgi:cell division septation protein DedD